MGTSFQHEGHYMCECGREFTKAQSYNAHLSHCKTHLGDERYAASKARQKAASVAGNIAKKEKFKQIVVKKKSQKQLIWEQTTHYCEKCGIELPSNLENVFGSGRFCSRKCANSHEHSEETRLLIGKNSREAMLKSERYAKYHESYELSKPHCLICGCELSYEDRGRKTCRSEECIKELRKINGIKASESVRHTYCARSGYYNNVFMASSWELAFYAWHEINNIKIEKNKTYFSYTFEGKDRLYLPDFIVDGEYIEIKGKGKWYNESEVKAKTSSCNAKILYLEDLDNIFNEVCDYYNVKDTVELSELLYEK